MRVCRMRVCEFKSQALNSREVGLSTLESQRLSKISKGLYQGNKISAPSTLFPSLNEFQCLF